MNNTFAYIDEYKNAAGVVIYDVCREIEPNTGIYDIVETYNNEADAQRRVALIMETLRRFVKGELD